MKDLGCIEANPVVAIPKLGKVVDEAAKPIPDDDRRLLMAAMRKYDRQLWIVCLLQYYCAIRPGECRLLKVGDLDFDGETIRVPKDVSKNREGETVVMPTQLVRQLKKKGMPMLKEGCICFLLPEDLETDRSGRTTSVATSICCAINLGFLRIISYIVSSTRVVSL